MKKYLLFIGIDISKSWIDASLTIDGEKTNMLHRRFSNTEKGFVQLLSWVGIHANKLSVLDSWLFCMEHTGVYTLPLCAFLECKNLDFVIESALQIKRSIGIRRGKDDKSDSKDIAQYAFLHAKRLKVSVLPAEQMMRLKNLLAHRARLVKQRTMLKSSIKEFKSFMPEHFSPDCIEEDSKELIKVLSSKIGSVEKQLVKIIETDKELQRLYELVKSVKGIGLISAITLLVYTNCFKSFRNARKFACYIAIAPFTRQSGISLKLPGRINKMGYTKIKVLLSSCALTATKYDHQLKAYYQRKLSEGKTKSSALNAVKNKLISRVFAVVKRGTPYVELQY